jgi:hypothetical protein
MNYSYSTRRRRRRLCCEFESITQATWIGCCIRTKWRIVRRGFGRLCHVDSRWSQVRSTLQYIYRWILLRLNWRLTNLVKIDGSVCIALSGGTDKANIFCRACWLAWLELATACNNDVDIAVDVRGEDWAWRIPAAWHGLSFRYCKIWLDTINAFYHKPVLFEYK